MCLLVKTWLEQQITFWFVNVTVLCRNPTVRGALTLTADTQVCYKQHACQTWLNIWLWVPAREGVGQKQSLPPLSKQPCSCVSYGVSGTGLGWMFDHLHSRMQLDSSCWYGAPASPWGATNLLIPGGKKLWGCCFKPEEQPFSVLDHGRELISDVRASSELCLNILKMHLFTWKTLTRLTQCDKCLVVTLPNLEKSASLAGNQGNGKNVKNSLFQVGKQSENLHTDCGWEEH